MIIYLLFADDLIMLASLSQNLHYALGQFAVECEVDEMRINTSKSKVMVLYWKRVACPHGVLGWAHSYPHLPGR